MKCPAWFHWRRRRVIARRVIHCPVNWIMQDHAAFFIFHIITIIIIVIIISDDSSPLKFTSSSMKRTQGKSHTAMDESLLQNVNWIVFKGSYTHISFPLPYYSPSSDSFFLSHHFCCLDVIIILKLFHRKHKSSPRSARTTSMWTRKENNVIFRGRSHLIWSEAADIKGNFPPCGRFWLQRPCLLTLDLDKWVWWNNWNRECIVAPT